MAKVLFKRYETDAEAQSANIIDGQFIVTKEGTSYTDYGTDRVAFGGTLDTQMSDSSINGVQNKVIKEYVDDNIETVRNYVDKNTYSTTETVIGTYNGKTLYRKQYYVTNLSFGSWVDIATDSTYEIKKWEGVYFRTNNRADGFVNGGDTAYSPLVVTIRNNQLEYQIKSSYSADAVKAEFTIEYTKTTDV